MIGPWWQASVKKNWKLNVLLVYTFSLEAMNWFVVPGNLCTFLHYLESSNKILRLGRLTQQNTQHNKLLSVIEDFNTLQNPTFYDTLSVFPNTSPGFYDTFPYY